jgi:hypothetical protein
MTPAQLVNAIGLAFDIIGVLFLWKYGLPSPVNREGKSIAVYNVSDESVALAKRCRIMSGVGIVLICVGFIFQFASDFVSGGVRASLIASPPQSPTAAVVRQQLPSATELFTLRSKCNEFGEKILEDNPVGSALYQTQRSRYDVKTGRCYVEVTVETADTTISPDKRKYSRYLYDGLTKDLLANQSNERGGYGMVYGKGILGFDQTGEYIDKIMKED